MASTDSVERKWLIKSSGKILGPLTLEEVIVDLRQKKISVIDEVRSPQDRWMFIRENKFFAPIVQMLREEQMDSREDTSTTFVGTKSMTSSITQEVTPPPVSSAKSIPIPASQTPPPPSATEPPPPAPTDEEERPTHISFEPEATPQPVYASHRDPRLKKRIAPQRRRAAVVAWMILFVVIVGVILSQFIPRRDSGKQLGYEDLIRLAKTSRSVGQYEKSLEFFRKAESLHALDFSEQLQMAPLLMVVENQNVQARQMLEQLSLKPNLEAKTRGEIQSLIALTYLREAQLGEARKRYEEIEKNFKDNDAARINLVEISILQGQLTQALEKINSLVKEGIKEPILFLLRILTIYRTTDDVAKLEGARADLKRLLSQNPDGQSEMLLLLAAIQKKLGQEMESGETIKTLLNTDPDQTKNHLHDWFIHREVVEWGYLSNICDLVTKGNANSPIFKGLTVYCTYEQGDLKSSLDQMEKLRAQFSSSPSLVGLHAFLLFKAGRQSEAKALLQLPQAKDQNLALSVRASLCESQKDWNCAEQTWKKVLQADPHSVGAFAGIARAELQQGQTEMAQDYLKQGLLISSNYQPFLVLKERLNEH